jgi:amidohydrolase
MRPGVFSAGWTRAGSAENVIPNRAEAGATLRVLHPEDRLPLREAAREIVTHTALAHGCTAEIEVTEGEPATVNDPSLAGAARILLPDARLALAPPMRSCGSDDFGFYGTVAPTLMAFVGLAGAPGETPFPLHHPAFLPPAEAVGVVARTLAALYAAAATR